MTCVAGGSYPETYVNDIETGAIWKMRGEVSKAPFLIRNCSGSEMRPREFSGSRGGGWRQVGHEGLADDQLMTGVQKVVALFAAGGEIAANPGESLRPGQRAKAA